MLKIYKFYDCNSSPKKKLKWIVFICVPRDRNKLSMTVLFLIAAMIDKHKKFKNKNSKSIYIGIDKNVGYIHNMG